MNIKTYENLWNAAKAVPRGMFTALKKYYKRRKRHLIN